MSSILTLLRLDWLITKRSVFVRIMSFFRSFPINWSIDRTGRCVEDNSRNIHQWSWFCREYWHVIIRFGGFGVLSDRESWIVIHWNIFLDVILFAHIYNLWLSQFSSKICKFLNISFLSTLRIFPFYFSIIRPAILSWYPCIPCQLDQHMTLESSALNTSRAASLIISFVS